MTGPKKGNIINKTILRVIKMNLKTILKAAGFVMIVLSAFTAAAAIAYKIAERFYHKPMAVIECDGENTKISA